MAGEDLQHLAQTLIVERIVPLLQAVVEDVATGGGVDNRTAAEWLVYELIDYLAQDESASSGRMVAQFEDLTPEVARAWFGIDDANES